MDSKLKFSVQISVTLDLVSDPSCDKLISWKMANRFVGK